MSGEENSKTGVNRVSLTFAGYFLLVHVMIPGLGKSAVFHVIKFAHDNFRDTKSNKYSVNLSCRSNTVGKIVHLVL
jgi:hypothetical protein